MIRLGDMRKKEFSKFQDSNETIEDYRSEFNVFEPSFVELWN